MCKLISLGASCASPVTLLEGRRKVDGVTLRASNSMIFHSPSEALLSGKGWCSGQLGADIFDPFLEVNFGASMLFTAIVTEGFGGTLLQKGFFLERYQVKLAREDGHLWYLAKPTNSNSSQLEEAVSCYSTCRKGHSILIQAYMCKALTCSGTLKNDYICL